VRIFLTIIVFLERDCTDERAADAAAPNHDIECDLVVANRRVIDPASGRDGIRSIDITGQTIAAISAE
jgi:hypothetical protein